MTYKIETGFGYSKQASKLKYINVQRHLILFKWFVAIKNCLCPHVWVLLFKFDLELSSLSAVLDIFGVATPLRHLLFGGLLGNVESIGLAGWINLCVLARLIEGPGVVDPRRFRDELALKSTIFDGPEVAGRLLLKN